MMDESGERTQLMNFDMTEWTLGIVPHSLGTDNDTAG